MGEEGALQLFTDSTDDLVRETLEEVGEWLRTNPATCIEAILERVYNCAMARAEALEAVESMEGENSEVGHHPSIETLPDAGWIRINALTKRLEAKEQELRRLGEVCSAGPREQEKVFSSSASSLCLRNELIGLMRDAAELGCEVEPIEDNIFLWRVKMTNFASDSDLFLDLTQIYDRFGYSYVEFRLSFAVDLFPFYPPMVSIVRPRFHGFMPGKLANLEELQPSNWDVVDGIRGVLGRIRGEFERTGRIDIEAAGNDLSCAEGSYLPIENLLLKLGLATETHSVVAFEGGSRRFSPSEKHDHSKRLKTESSSNLKDSGTERRHYWAKGTGYGHGASSGSKWTPEQYLAIKQEKSRAEAELMEKVVGLLLEDLISEGRSRLDAILAQKTLSVLKSSCLVPLMLTRLSSSTFLEMDRCSSLFNNYLRTLHLLTSIASYRPILQFRPSIDGPSLDSLVAQMILKLSRFGESLDHNRSLGSPLLNQQQLFSAFPTSFDEYMFVVFQAVQEASPIERTCASLSAKYDLTVSKSDPLGMDPAADYCRKMKALQFEEVSELRDYHYASEIQGSRPHSSGRLKRLAKELADLSDSLPLSASSTVWVRLLEGRMDALQAMISGPEGTPYSNGLFLFDVFFPENYPAEPPKVNLQTTGRNSVRFNPNLYNNGKVCLSLLGTWRGDDSEAWSETTSTFLQVLVSIQSLILVPEPYFNEPGYESSIGTQDGISASKTYNERIRQAWIHSPFL